MIIIAHIIFQENIKKIVVLESIVFFEENKKTILNQQPIGGRWRVIIDIIEETVKWVLRGLT